MHHTGGNGRDLSRMAVSAGPGSIAQVTREGFEPGVRIGRAGSVAVTAVASRARVLCEQVPACETGCAFAVTCNTAIPGPAIICPAPLANQKSESELHRIWKMQQTFHRIRMIANHVSQSNTAAVRGSRFAAENRARRIATLTHAEPALKRRLICFMVAYFSHGWSKRSADKR